MGAHLGRAVLFLAALGFAGCAAPDAILGAPQPGDELALALSPDWSARERTAVSRALETWRSASHGCLAVHIADVNEQADATLHRGPTPDGGAGWYSRPERALTVDADAIADVPDGVEAMTANLVGQIVGMPLHDGPRGVLSRGNVTAEVTADDRASCRAAGYCC